MDKRQLQKYIFDQIKLKEVRFFNFEQLEKLRFSVRNAFSTEMWEFIILAFDRPSFYYTPEADLITFKMEKQIKEEIITGG